MNRFSQDFVCLLHLPALGNTKWNDTLKFLRHQHDTGRDKQTGFQAVIAIIVAIMRKCHPPIEIDFGSCPPGKHLSVCKSQGWRIWHGRSLEPGSVVGAKRPKKSEVRQQKYASGESQMDSGQTRSPSCRNERPWWGDILIFPKFYLERPWVQVFI